MVTANYAPLWGTLFKKSTTCRKPIVLNPKAPPKPKIFKFKTLEIQPFQIQRNKTPLKLRNSKIDKIFSPFSCKSKEMCGKVIIKIEKITKYNKHSDPIKSSLPFALHFECEHFNKNIEADIADIYAKITNGTIQKEFRFNKRKIESCQHNVVAGVNGNRFLSLFECRCSVLNRFSDPSIRAYFENIVIDKICTIYEKKPFNNFNIAVFAPGRLLGELIFSIRLISALKKKKFKGTINLILIDEIYKKSIKKSSDFNEFCHSVKNRNITKVLGDRKDLVRFLAIVTKGLTKSIKLKGSLFGSIEDYTIRAKKDHNFRFDLLMGQDTQINGGKDKDVFYGKILGDLHRSARRRKIPGIFLEKYFDIPQICEVDERGYCTPSKLVPTKKKSFKKIQRIGKHLAPDPLPKKEIEEPPPKPAVSLNMSDYIIV